MGTEFRFRGTLETGDTQIPVLLALTEASLSLHTDDAQLGEWTFDEVNVERSKGARFNLKLGEDTAVFVADDPVGVAYSVPEWIALHIPKRSKGIQRRLDQRGSEIRAKLRRSGRKAEHVHQWNESKLGGGLIRRVCVGCDQVSIDLREAEEATEPAGAEESTQPTGAEESIG